MRTIPNQLNHIRQAADCTATTTAAVAQPERGQWQPSEAAATTTRRALVRLGDDKRPIERPTGVAKLQFISIRERDHPAKANVDQWQAGQQHSRAGIQLAAGAPKLQAEAQFQLHFCAKRAATAAVHFGHSRADPDEPEQREQAELSELETIGGLRRQRRRPRAAAAAEHK